MKILIVSDEVAPQVYDTGIKARFADVDFVLSCGDVPHDYLEFIASMLNVPLYYVLGNHCEELQCNPDDGTLTPPGGCEDLDERAQVSHGLVLAGLQGSMRYKAGPYQYTEMEMARKTVRLAARLFPHRLRRGRWLDILVTHAPPFGIHDGPDRCHTGFRALLKLMDWCRPRYLIHGHCHNYDRLRPTTTAYRQTLILNAHPYRVLELPREGEPGRAGEGGQTPG